MFSLPNNDEALFDCGSLARFSRAAAAGINVLSRPKATSFSHSSRSLAGNMEARCSTDRLAVVPWSTPLSTTELTELGGILDTEVTAFLPPHLQYEPGTTDVSKWASTFAAGESAVSSVRLLGTNELCGLILLRPEEESSLYVGYIFGKRHWGKGLATELLRGLVDQLTAQRFVGELHAGVDRQNPASAAVLRKVGFNAMGPSTIGDKPTDVDWYYRKFDGK